MLAVAVAGLAADDHADTAGIPGLCRAERLGLVRGPASLHAGKVLDAFGGAQEAWEARETEEFRQAAGDAAFKRAAQLDAESCHTLVMQCDALRVRILPFDDPDYPLAFS